VNDDSPKVEKVDFLTTHLGQERFTKLKNDVSKWAEEKGIPMSALLDNPIQITDDFCHRSFKGVMSQTTRAHRLCQKAYKMGGQKLQVPILCAVFKAHMEDGLDIANIGVLADLAESVGLMAREEVRHFWCEFTWVLKLHQAVKFLESDELEKEVNDMCSAARSKGITGVPMTIIDGKWAVSGGQSSEVFIQVRKIESLFQNA